MKVRLRLQDKISKKQQKDIQAYCDNEVKRKEIDSSRRMIKIFCVALNETFGFGASRLLKVINKITELSQRRDDDPVFWYRIDRDLRQMGLEFEPEDYDLVDY